MEFLALALLHDVLFFFLFTRNHSEIYLIPSLKNPLIPTTIEHQNLSAAMTTIQLKHNLAAALLPVETQQLLFFFKELFSQGIKLYLCVVGIKK